MELLLRSLKICGVTSRHGRVPIYIYVRNEFRLIYEREYNILIWISKYPQIRICRIKRLSLSSRGKHLMSLKSEKFIRGHVFAIINTEFSRQICIPRIPCGSNSSAYLTFNQQFFRPSRRILEVQMLYEIFMKSAKNDKFSVCADSWVECHALIL